MTDSQVIENLGGSSQLARLCHLTPQAVSLWKSNGIPKAWRMFLKAKHPKAFISTIDQEPEKRKKSPAISKVGAGGTAK